MPQNVNIHLTNVNTDRLNNCQIGWKVATHNDLPNTTALIGLWQANCGVTAQKARVRTHVDAESRHVLRNHYTFGLMQLLRAPAFHSLISYSDGIESQLIPLQSLGYLVKHVQAAAADIKVRCRILQSLKLLLTLWFPWNALYRRKKYIYVELNVSNKVQRTFIALPHVCTIVILTFQFSKRCRLLEAALSKTAEWSFRNSSPLQWLPRSHVSMHHIRFRRKLDCNEGHTSEILIIQMSLDIKQSIHQMPRGNRSSKVGWCVICNMTNSKNNNLASLQ